MRKVLSVVGTRPNLMKTAPIIAALERRGVDQVLVHTGQHYDDAMSDVFFRELGIPEPNHFLEVGSGTHAQQTARVMERLEPVLLAEQPDLGPGPGGGNPTMAAAPRGNAGAGRGGKGDAGRVPGPPAHARRSGSAGHRDPGRDRPGRLPRIPGARRRGRGGADRLRRDPGGDDLPGDPVLHAAR